MEVPANDAFPPIDGLDRIDFLTSPTILDMRELPEHLIVVGGGFIGCEFAQMFARFGSRVTVVQRADRLLPGEDPDISTVVEDAVVAEAITGTHLLIATGRTPNTDDLGIEHVDLNLDARGYVPVDGQLRTEVEDVWALGDLRGVDMFTHTARDDAEVAYRSVFRDQQATIEDRVVPHAVFVDPEVAAVGLTEVQARDAGYDVAVGSQEFAGVAKARAMGETAGFIRFVVDAATDAILGCHIVGPEAGNLIHEAVIAMAAGIPYSQIGDAIHIHPTLAEGVNAAAGGVHRPSV